MTMEPVTTDMGTGTEVFGIRRTHALGLGMLLAICLIPLALMGMGVDFSSAGPALSADGVAEVTVDEASRKLRGSSTHTLLEWTVLGAVFLIGLLAGYVSRYRKGEASASALRRALQIGENNQLALDEHAIVSIADIKGDIIYINDKFCEISGYSREELMGQNHRMVKSDEHSREFYRELWMTISQGKTWSGEIKNLTKKGAPYWVAATIVPFKDDEGKIEQYVAIRTDITERKRSEEELRRNLEELEQFNRLAEGRELRMIELKEEVNELLRETGRQQTYRVDVGGPELDLTHYEDHADRKAAKIGRMEPHDESTDY